MELKTGIQRLIIQITEYTNKQFCIS